MILPFMRYLRRISVIIFFANAQPIVSLINTFAVFALGYLARPLGGMVFGHFGDKYGRKTTFALAVFIMALATLLMGCLPSYERIGVAAPLLLIVLRFIQGFSVGGEIPGATVFILEHIPKKKQGFAVGLIFAFITLGNTLGALVGWLLTHFLRPDQMLAWGWRMPFIIGFALGLISYMIHKRANETPIFIAMQQAQTLHPKPLWGLLSYPNKTLRISFLMTAVTSSILSLFLYLPTYLTMILKCEMKQTYLINSVSFLSLALCTAFFGFLSDKILRTRLILVGVVSLILFSYPLFYGLQYFGLPFVWAFVLIMAVLGGFINGSYVVIIGSLFPGHLRYSGVGLSYSLGVALFGGTAPLAFTWLLQSLSLLEAPALYIIFCAAMTGYAVLQYKKERYAW